ncbi:MAG TPA: hypothetical protein DEP57_08995 [Selenomonas sp.]|nr:hypothetical protein [Selenomonas sp.]
MFCKRYDSETGCYTRNIGVCFEFRRGLETALFPFSGINEPIYVEVLKILVGFNMACHVESFCFWAGNSLVVCEILKYIHAFLNMLRDG